MRLFVYGSLMRGKPFSGYLEKQEFVTPAKTSPKYCLYNTGHGYPAMVEDAGGVSIHGEIWEVKEEHFQLLDELEGVEEGLYERRKDIELEDGSKVTGYLFSGSVKGMLNIGNKWTG